MKWFEGGIAEAIAESRQKKALFVVNVQNPPESADEKSIRMAHLWDAVDNNVCTPDLIGIRIFDGTEPAKQFAQIYPVPIVPASYIIDLKGKPLDVITITEEMDEDVFLQRLKIAVKMLHTADQPSSSTSGPAQSKLREETGENQELKSLSDEKIKKARELLEKKHAEAELLKKTEEQRKEIERRNLGKQMTEAKLSREERERREIAEQRKRDKREQEAYLKRLREQIKADKEERMNRMKCNMHESKQENKAENLQAHAPSSVPDSAECRIQCKFSDGTTLVHQFASTDAFSVLVELVKKDGRQGEDFYLVQMYPRREFSDITKTFAELGLAPSATILVVSKQKRTVTAFGGSRWTEFLQYAIVAPFQALYRMLLYLVGYGGGGSTAAASSDRTKPSATKSGIKRLTGDSRKQRNYVRQDGNLRRFHNEDDSSNSDDEATWNGNSTQQL